MAGSFKLYILNWGSMSHSLFPPPFNKFSTPHGFSLSSYSLITQFFPPTSSPTLNSRQQVGWPPDETTDSMKSKGWQFHGLDANDVFLYTEPESPACTHEVAKAQPTQVRQQNVLALCPEVLRLPRPITSGHIILCSLPQSHLL